METLINLITFLLSCGATYLFFGLMLFFGGEAMNLFWNELSFNFIPYFIIAIFSFDLMHKSYNISSKVWRKI